MKPSPREALANRMSRGIRMLNAGIIAAIGQLVVDMPNGYFGPTDRLTTAGLTYAGSMLAGTSLCALAAVMGWTWARWVFVIVATLGLAFFLPAVPSDVTVTAVILAWQIVTLGAELSYRADRQTWRVHDPALAFRPIAVHLSVASLLVTLLVVGFQLTSLVAGQIACLLLGSVAVVVAVACLWTLPFVRIWAAASCVVVVGTAMVADGLLPIIAVLGATQATFLGVAVSRGPLFSELVRHFVDRPAQQVLMAFGAIAAIGAVLLTFPAAAEGPPLAPLDALFTSVSATCVTGLIVVDTPTVFSTFGEAVVLLLIQVGGLGIMVLSTFAMILLGQRLTLRGELALERSLELSVPQKAYSLVRFIVVATLTIESAGALLLTLAYLRHGLPFEEAVWRAVFHAVSAFCNAGFALQTDSIVMFQSDPMALLVHAGLIIAGGLGFVVIAWLVRRLLLRKPERASVQVKVVLWLSLVFIIGGSVLYALLEWNASLRGLAWPDKLTNAFFQSVTMRTAGFNSVDLAAMRPATVLLTIVFMFIGAAPGGTGGGIKVTTFAVLTAALSSAAGVGTRATLFRRTIPESILLRAATIAAVSLSVGCVALFGLLLSEDAEVVPLWFETISALGTVGLSLGATSNLSAVGKLIIIGTMFIGRTGPLTLALAIGGRRRPAIQYPDTTIMVG